MSYQITYTTEFIRLFTKIKKKDRETAKKIRNCIEKISLDPFQPPLKTHLANISGYGVNYSSRVTGDIRVAWKFTGQESIILCLKVGGHDEVY